MAIHTIYFWPDLEAGLREIHGLLAPGGQIAIGIRPAERGRPRRLDPMVYEIPTSAQLTDALQAVGFVETTMHDSGQAVVVVAHIRDEIDTVPAVPADVSLA